MADGLQEGESLGPVQLKQGETLGPAPQQDSQLQEGETLGPAQPEPEKKFYQKHPANVLYRDIRSRETPQQVAARQETAKNVMSRIEQPVRTEDIMTPDQQKNHPWVAGGMDLATGMVTPMNVAIMVGTGGLGTLEELAGSAGAKIAYAGIQRLMSAGFTAQQVWDGIKESKEVYQALKDGDEARAERAFVHAAGDLGFAALGAQHAAGVEATPSTKIGRVLDEGVRRVQQSMRSDSRATSVANARQRAASISLDQRLTEHGTAADQAVAANKAADEAKTRYQKGEITKQELDQANNNASKQVANLNKATKALAQAHEDHGLASAEVDRMNQKLERNKPAMDEKKTKSAQGAREDFERLAPSAKRGPASYEDEDYDRTRPYLEYHHKNVEPIRDTQGMYDALDYIQNGMEQQIAPHIERYAKDPITTNVRMDVRDALSGNPDVEFAKKGMKELESYNLTDPTLEEADRIRKNLVAKQRASGYYDYQTAMEADPTFAARAAAIQSLRDGIYGTLEEKGISGVRDLRTDEASVIKLRNAVENQLKRGDTAVRGSGESGPRRKAAAWSVQKLSTMAGAEMGGPKGAAVGEWVGEKLGRLIAPGDLTRDELAARTMIHEGAPGISMTKIYGPGMEPGPYPLQQAVSPRMNMYTPQRELTPLHTELAAHYGENLDDSTYTQLEDRFKAEIASKNRHGVPLETPEKALLKKILDADAGDRKAAQEQLAQDQAKNQQRRPTYPKNVEPLMDVPASRMPKGLVTKEAIVHDIARAVVGNERGLEFPDGIRSHLHPETGSGAMSAPMNMEEFLKEDGTIDQNKLKTRITDFAATAVAGAVANDLYHDIPFTENENIPVLKRYLRETGFTPTEVSKMIAQAAEDAAEHLGQPAVRDMIEGHAGVREAGLDSKYHISPERMEQILEDVGNVYEKTGKSGRVSKAGDKGLGEVRAGAKGTTKEGDTAEVRPEGQGPDRAEDREIGENEPAKITAGTEPGTTVVEPNELDKEIHTPFKEPYKIRIEKPTGETEIATIPEYSMIRAMKSARKQFPGAFRTEIESTPVGTAFGESLPQRTVEYSVPKNKHLNMRYSIDRPPEDTFRHEFGHVLMGLKDGGTTDGMIRHTHPRAPSDMRAGVLWSNREFYTQGKLNLEKIPGLIRRVMGGIAADELFNNIPRSANHNLPIDAGGDGASAYKVLRGIGFTHEEAWEHMHRAIDQAKQYLTHPEVSRIIQENIATREPGLSTQYHYSPERLNSIHQELQRRINESGEPAVDYRRVSGAGSTGRAEAIAGAEGRATEAVRPTTKAAELTQDRVSTRVPRGKSPQENPLEGEPLLVGQDALAKALGFEKKIADKVQDYPGAKIPANVKDPAKIVKRHIDRMADNLKWP